MPSPGLHASDAATGRRDLLKKLAAGGAAVWVAPAIASAPAAAQQGSGSIAFQTNCPTSASVSFRLTAPAQYQGGGFYWGFVLTTEGLGLDSCKPGLVTAFPIGPGTVPYSFVGSGIVGTADIFIHDGDCIPIVGVTVPFDCTVRRAPAAEDPAAPGTITTRSETGEITVIRG